MLNNVIIEKYAAPFDLELNLEIDKFEEFLNLMNQLLMLHEINFKYQRRNCKRSGAAVMRLNRTTGVINYTLLIDPECGDIAKMNIFTHELMHILLDHHLKKADNQFYLPQRAREFVVDFLAESFVYSLTKLNVKQYANQYMQFQNAIEYRKKWLENARLSPQSIQVLELQINYGIELLSEYVKEQTIDKLY